jgi:hypothetical protein
MCRASSGGKTVRLLNHFIRLRALQQQCFERNKRRWAKALGHALRALVQDNPELRDYL